MALLLASAFGHRHHRQWAGPSRAPTPPHSSVPARTFLLASPAEASRPSCPVCSEVAGSQDRWRGRHSSLPPQGRTGHTSCLPPPTSRPGVCRPLHFAFLSLETSGCYKHSLLTLPSIGCPGAQEAKKKLGLAYHSLGQPRWRVLGNGRRGAGPVGAMPL